jgi:hypothetical protein
MKRKLREKVRAAAPTTAPTIEPQNRVYLTTTSRSSLKTLIGGLLLFGDRKPKAFWPLFDVLLRQLVDLRLASQSRSDKPGATKSDDGGMG